MIESLPEGNQIPEPEIEEFQTHDNQINTQNNFYDLEIDILGKRFFITVSGNPEYLEEVLNQYKMVISITQGISEFDDPFKVALVAGFKLCDEYNKLKMQIEEEKLNDEKEFDRIAKNLISCLDEVMEKADSLDE